MAIYRFLADAVVVFHAAYVGFVIAGLLAVVVGTLLHWHWIRNFWFRWIHFSLIAIVVVESLFGVECPLTTWEDSLRGLAGEDVVQGTFLGRCAHDLIFYEEDEVPKWAWAIIYSVFGGIVLAVMVLVPPQRAARGGTPPDSADVVGS